MASDYRYVKNIRKRMKDFSVLAMGEKCQICGYGSCSAALEFHHINPDEKDFDFRSVKSWDKLCDELEKCILLCCRCHREVHYEVVQVPREYVKLDRKLVEILRTEYADESRKKANIIRLDTLKYSDAQREEFVELIHRGLSSRQISRITGMTQSNVRYRIKKYGLVLTNSK